MCDLKKFIEICQKGNIDEFNNFLLEFPEINIHAKNELTFRLACQDGHLDIVEKLLELEETHGKIDIHAENEYAFQWACQGSNLHIVEKLLELEETHGKIDIHAEKEGAFNFACFGGHLDILNRLLELEETRGKIDIHAGDEYAFRWACEFGHVDILNRLLELEETHGRIDIHAVDEHAFKSACMNSHLDILEKLLELEETHGKIDIHAKKNELAFRWACQGGHLHIVEKLLELEETHGKIDIHAEKEGAFQWACQGGHLHIVDKLLELEETHGKIDIHAEDDKAFQCACENGHLDIVEKLLELEETHRKINIHAQNESAFRLACKNGHLDIVNRLLELEETHGQIDIHDCDEYAYVFAYMNGHTKTVSILSELLETRGAIDFKKASHQVSEIISSRKLEESMLSRFVEFTKNPFNINEEDNPREDKISEYRAKGQEGSQAAVVMYEMAKILRSTENSKSSSSSSYKPSSHMSMDKNKNYVAKKVDIPEIRIAGIDELKDKIIGEITATRKIELDDPELFKDLGIQHEKGVLLHGPPGTGKTLLAKALISQISTELKKNGIETRYLVINGPEIVNKYLGETEKNIRMIFDNSANCRNNKVFFIYVFDEFDALVPCRQSDNKSFENKPINQFLTMIDGIDTPQNFFIIGTTNMKDLIDPAILRSGRIGLDYKIDMPDQSKKKEIVKFYFEKLIKHNIIDCVDYKLLVMKMDGFTPADIANLSQKITKKWCLLNKKKLSESEIDEEIGEVMKKVGNLDDENLTYFI